MSGVTYTVVMQPGAARWQSYPAIGGGSPLVHTISLLPNDEIQDKDLQRLRGR